MIRVINSSIHKELLEIVKKHHYCNSEDLYEELGIYMEAFKVSRKDLVRQWNINVDELKNGEYYLVINWVNINGNISTFGTEIKRYKGEKI